MQVFSPVLGKDLKLTAEELEMGLIKPNSAVAQLHIMLLKVLLLLFCSHTLDTTLVSLRSLIISQSHEFHVL